MYSQNDPRWSRKKLGHSKTLTIGGYGCAVTAIVNFHNKAFGTSITPLQLNDLLVKQPNGFVNQTLVNWIVAAKVLPRMKFISRDWNYNNLTVWRWINVSPKMPVIIAVRPSFVPQHFVLFIGNGQMIDSLDGKVKSTSAYKTLIGSVRYTK